jgi:hypothetical protein
LECEKKFQVAYCAFFCKEIDTMNGFFYQDRGRVEEEEEAQIECLDGERETHRSLV